MRKVETEKSIRQIVKSSVIAYAKGFELRHISEIDNPDGVINMKINNVFIDVLGEEIKFYAALVRSLDSSLGNMLENMAINIAELFYKVSKRVEGSIYDEQISIIADLLEKYKNANSNISPSIEHYKLLQNFNQKGKSHRKVHISDYYLYDSVKKIHYLIELKIGGDLDNKKARAEKEAIFEQYSILSNLLDHNEDIKCYFATAYNRFGENKEWKQQRVLQFFSKDELLIGKDFWNFICCSDKGYNIVLSEYKKNAIYIKDALSNIKNSYLK